MRSSSRRLALTARIAITAVALTSHEAAAQRGGARREQAPLVPVPGAERLAVTDRVTGVRYQVDVAFPVGADRTVPRPVILVLDGDDDFAMAARAAEAVRGECELPVPPLVVGIGDGASIGAPGNRRDRDYTPVPSEVSWARGAGGAAAFVRFLAEDLVPSIERAYRTTGSRALFGFSYGGLLGATALLERPALADAWLLGSPSLFYGDQWAITRARRATSTPARLFLAAGSREDWAIEGNRAFAAALAASGHAPRDLASVVIPGAGHALAKPQAMLRAFAWLSCTGPVRDWAAGGGQ
jgi:predicted alpha/beta superfamily hydrolase